MSVQTTASQSIVNMMKEDLADKIFIHMNLESTELQIFKLETRALNGKYYRLNFQTAGNSRFEARAEGDYIPGFNPDASIQDRIAPLAIEELKFGRRQMYASVDFTGPMAAAVKSKEGGYSNIMEYRFKDTERHLVERVGIALAYGETGVVGKIKTCGSGEKASGIPVLYSQSEDGGGTPTEPCAGNRLIRPGMVLDAVSGGRLGAVRVGDKDRGRRVTAVSADNSAPTVTFKGEEDGTSSLVGNGWAADDLLVSTKTRQVAAINSTALSETGWYGPRGLLDVVDDDSLNTYYGQVDRTDYQSLRCQRLENSGTLRAISLDLINLGCEQSEVVAGGKPDVIYTTPGIRRQLVAFLTATTGSTLASVNPTRFNSPGSEKVTIGVNQFDVLTLGPTGRMTIMSSRLAPHHMVFLLQRDTTLLMQDSPPGFIDNDGLKVRMVDGKDEFTAAWKWYVPGMICREPWKNVRIDDVTGSSLA